jgi:hypothetical protein
MYSVVQLWVSNNIQTCLGFFLVMYHGGENPTFYKIKYVMKVLHFVLHYIWRHCLLLVMHYGDPIFLHQMKHMLIMVVFCMYSNMGVGVGRACVVVGMILLRLGFKNPLQVHFCR